MLTRSDDLEVFLAVVDNRGFSSAAEVLGIQIARVSRAVSRIEDQLGVTLLNRTTRRIELTEEGRQFVSSIRVGLTQLQQAEEDIVSRGDLPKGRLRVDAVSPFLFHQLVPLIKPFRDAYPDIELELTSNEGYVDLLENQTDIAIRIGRLTDSTLHARSLGKSELYIVTSPDYIARRGCLHSPEDLRFHDIVGFNTPRNLNKWPLPGRAEIEPTVMVSNGELIRQLALAGNGIACLSGFMVKQDIEQGRLIPLFESMKVTNTGYEQINAVFYKSSSVAKRISAFIDFIQPRLTL